MLWNGQQGRRDDLWYIRWAQSHHEELKKLGSNLEFDLHRLRFIQLLREQRQMEALAYGQKHFFLFADKHMTGK